MLDQQVLEGMLGQTHGGTPSVKNSAAGFVDDRPVIIGAAGFEVWLCGEGFGKSLLRGACWVLLLAGSPKQVAGQPTKHDDR